MRKNVLIFGDCLRITVGTPEENERLIEALKNFRV
jgi:histidinol-phosphate/aromatic aminotransferase/cobyric acid decarboxylase-like protein